MTHGVVEIRGLNPQYNRFRFFINNFNSIEYNLDTVVDAMPLPQANDELNVLTKTSGNTLRISISWTLVDEDETVVLGNSVLDDALSGSTPANISDLKEADETTQKYLDGTVNTADEQARFLLEDFQNAGIEFRYAIIVGDTKLDKQGVIERIQMRKTGQAPVTYQASLTFLVGDVVVKYEKFANYNIFNCVAKFTFKQTAEIINQAKILFCCDGGLMHSANAVKTPIISLFARLEANMQLTESICAFPLFDKRDVNNILVEDILQKYKEACNIVENHHSVQ